MHARDRPSRYGNQGARFFVVRGPVPRNRSSILAILTILAILIILAILLQTRETLIKIISFFANFVKLFFNEFGILAASDSNRNGVVAR